MPEGQKLVFALDAVSRKGNCGDISQVLSTQGEKLAMVLPLDPAEKIPVGTMAKQG